MFWNSCVCSSVWSLALLFVLVSELDERGGERDWYPSSPENDSKLAFYTLTPRFSAAGMVRMKNHEKSGCVHLIWNPGQVLTAGCGETPGRARTFISDQLNQVSPGLRTTTKAPSLHTNCNWLRPQGLKLRPQGLKAFLPNFSTWLRHLLADFDEWTLLVGKLEIPVKRRRHFCSCVAKGTNDSAVFKEGTHTFGSISPNPYLQRPDQFVQGRDRGVMATQV